MTQEIKTFRASSMQEALDLVRQELGSDAVILHTRQIAKKRFFPWQKPLEEIEITAGAGVVVHQPRVNGNASKDATATIVATTTTNLSPERTTLRHDGSNNRSTGATRISDHLAPPPDLLSEGGPSAERISPPRRTTTPPRNRVPATSPEPRAEHSTAAPIRPTPSPAPAPEPTLATGGLSSEIPPGFGRPVFRNARMNRADHNSAGVVPREPVATNPVMPRSALPSPGIASDVTAAIQDRLNTLQSMIDDLNRRQNHGTSDVPAHLFSMYTQLIESDVDAKFANEVVQRVAQVASADQLSDPGYQRSVLASVIASELQIAGPIRHAGGRQRVVALIGPTGVGKTTTLAKLAANFRLHDGLKLGLITVDTYRIAAVEQLRTYAEMIDLPMKVVNTPEEMSQALIELKDVDLVLIDTAGRSPRDDIRLGELKAILAAAKPDETLLVMSLSSGARALETTAVKFFSAGVTSLVVTKLDETSTLGTLLSISRSIPLPISYLTTGQDVPSDIEPAHADRIARLIAGLDCVRGADCA